MNVPEFEVMVFTKGLFYDICCQKKYIYMAWFAYKAAIWYCTGY